MNAAFGKQPQLIGQHIRSYATKARASPTVRRQRVNATAEKPSVSASQLISAEPLLRSAHRDGLLPMPVVTASALLQDFERLTSKTRVHRATLTELLQKHGLEPRALYQLGYVTNRMATGGKSWKLVSQALYRAATELGDEYAAFATVDRAIRSKQPNHADAKTALELLTTLSKSGNIAATERLAAVHELKGDSAQALSYAERVLSTLESSPPEETEEMPPPVRAWRVAANLKKASGDVDGHEAATRFGARHYQDPSAYHQLAAIVAPRSETMEARYLLKAASSGIGPAAYALGDTLLGGATGETGSSKPYSALLSILGIRNPGEKAAQAAALALAAEWFQVALEAAPKDDRIAQESAAKGAIAAMAATGNHQGCQALLEQHIESDWAKKISSAGRPIGHP